MSSFRQIFQTLKPRMQLQYYQWLPGFGVGFGFAGGFTGLQLFLEDKVHPALWGGFPILGGVFVGICVSPMYPAIVPFSMYHFLKACYKEYPYDRTHYASSARRESPILGR